MAQNQTQSLRMTIYTSLFTALIIIGGYLSFPIPLSPVPLVLSDFFVLLAGFFLGPAWGVAAIAMLLFLGGIGLPVFAGGKAGLAVLFGPTGGFLVGFAFCALVVGFIAGRGKPSVFKDIAALIAGNVLIYSVGLPWLKLILKITWGKALVLGLIPFLPGIIIKSVAAYGLIRFLRPKLNKLFINQIEG